MGKRILLTESINTIAKSELESQGHEVELLSYSPDQDELIKKLKDFDVIGIRSKTKLTADVLKEASHLNAIGCFCIGTNQVDLETAQSFGIPVFNAPHSNTRSVAELVIAEIVALARGLGDKNTNAHKGQWDKSASGSNEVRGKKLGIVGYGHIGSQVSVLAEGMGLDVYFYDDAKKLPLGNATPLNSLEELLKTCDFVTLHVPELPTTKDMIGASELKMMKKGSHLINASRGSVVVINDLASAIKEEHIAGAALDVFPVEPASNKHEFQSPLQGLKNVILTPHIGGSTEEAQISIGQEVSDSLNKFLGLGSTAGAVNFPNLDMAYRKNFSRLTNVHLNEPGMLGKINNIISKAGVNIGGQSLSTDETIGYLIIDVDSKKDLQNLADEIKALDKSVITRVLY